MVQSSFGGSIVDYFFMIRLVIDVEHLPMARCHFLPVLPEAGVEGGDGAAFLRTCGCGNGLHRLAIMDSGPRCLAAELGRTVIGPASGERVVPDAS
jgi:hypothetical protein